jgi:acyl-CoA reductase-like NAD-dependent aldehyde dehydrogenase
MSATEQAGTAAAEPTVNGNGAGPDGLDVLCPADGRVVGRIPIQGPAEIAEMAAELRAAQPEWEAMGPDARAKHLYNWLDWIFDNEERILRMVQDEAGKSWGDTAIETMVAVEVINYYAKNAKEFLSDRSYRPHGPGSLTKKLRMHVRPHQLVGAIIPWNYPLGNPMMDVPPALLAGAAVLSKPSEETPLAWAECVRGWREEIGAPPVLACALGDGSTGAAVVDVVDMIHFTGSTATGRKIGMRAAERLIPASLELGGKDPMIVLADADIDRAVNGAVWGGLFNGGQSCIAVERVYVEEPVYDEFVGKLTAAVQKLRVGMDAPGALEADFGALANQKQMDIVEGQVSEALENGARALTGGKRREGGLFYEPTVLVDVDHSMSCMRDETFGPTLPVMKVRNEEEAIELANDTPYGLGGSIWTGDNDRAQRVARRMEAGGICANNALVNVFQFPLAMGGWKQSGIGTRFGGPGGMWKYCRQQAFTSELVNMPSEIHWYPYTKTKSGISAKMVRLLGAHDWRRRLGRRPKAR